MNTSDKRPQRARKGAKAGAGPTAAPTDGGADGAATTAAAAVPPPAATSNTKNSEAAAARKNLAPAGATAAAAAPPADGPSVKAVRITVSSRHREDRHASIAKAAYFRAELRGFAPGHEVEDWLAAEEEVDQRLLGEGRVS